MTKPVVGALVYPLDWTGARLTTEPVAVVRTWTDANGNTWIGLADGRNFLAELVEIVIAGKTDQNRPEKAETMNRSISAVGADLWCAASDKQHFASNVRGAPHRPSTSQ